ncbi:UNVERIFIED_CONTAM: putative LRR receptor-like serine/threonine-protein kinase [Sesamum angustifolium]|uniref:LRR receptor-like serine/threonine-protein kinase n=1 Tax=Sesamum angustifolium TaxID=2727405 RepID=A0AAW2P048_9LAMI
MVKKRKETILGVEARKIGVASVKIFIGVEAKEWPIKSDPCTSWAGIQCSNGRVTGINISGFRRTRRGSQNPQFSVDALQNLTLLSSFNASHFKLPGSIPDWLGLQLASLQVLDLRSCLINGAIPFTLGNLSSLVELHLSDNNLTGVIPSSLGRLFGLSVLDLSQNLLTGSIPATVAELGNLTLLDMSSNFLSGVIPPGIGTLSALRFLNLSGNSLSSSIPAQLGDLSSLVELDLGFNSLSGGLVFDNFGEPNVTRPPHAPPDSDNKSHKLVIILASVLGERGTGVGPVPAGESPDPGVSLNFSTLGDAFTYQQILQATGELNDANLIKHGHSGDLFYGRLEGGIPVIIKKIDLHSSVKKEAYMLELELFSKVSHPRFVPLLGHCLENENEKFLVYKHMPNRDLSSALFKKTDPDDDSLQSLDWITRLKIAIGAAEGLTYLHHECTPPLVHRDVQASSILLDDRYEVRLGSLSEVCAQEGESHQSRITRTSDQGVSGTANATCAYDVYCFGKVLLELVTGKLGISSSTNPTTKEWLEATLPYISIYDKELVTNIVDPSLIIDEDLLEEVWAMAIVARSCLNPKPARQPLMSWRHSSSDVVATSAATTSHKGEGPSSFKQSGTTGSQGSGQNGEGNGHSSSTRRQSKDIFPEPLEEQDPERSHED